VKEAPLTVRPGGLNDRHVASLDGENDVPVGRRAAVPRLPDDPRDGRDIAPAGPERLYRTSAGVSGQPEELWLRDALSRLRRSGVRPFC